MSYVIVRERVTGHSPNGGVPKELSRKVRGRGRPPKNAVREGEDWVIYQDATSPSPGGASQEPPQKSAKIAPEPSRVAKDENTPSEVAEQVKTQPESTGEVPEPYIESPVGEIAAARKTRIEKSAVRLPFAKILEMCQDYPERRVTSEDGELITMQIVFICGLSADWESLTFNSLYRKIVLDKKADCIEVWVLSHDGPPNYRITEVFEP